MGEAFFVWRCWLLAFQRPRDDPIVHGRTDAGNKKIRTTLTTTRRPCMLLCDTNRHINVIRFRRELTVTMKLCALRIEQATLVRAATIASLTNWSRSRAIRAALTGGLCVLERAARRAKEDAAAKAAREGRTTVRPLSPGALALAAWLRDTGTSQRAAAKRGGLRKSAVGPYLSGERVPNASARRALELVTGGLVQPEMWEVGGG